MLKLHSIINIRNMVLDTFTTKFYDLGLIDKSKLRDFIKSETVDKYTFSHILFPKIDGKNIIALITTNNYSIFDLVEIELKGVEIDFELFVLAAKKLGVDYDSFFPSSDISDLV